MISYFRLFDKYVSVSKVSINNTFVYAGEIAYRCTFMMVILYVFTQLWGAAYTGNEVIAGFTYTQVIWYLVITETLLLSKIAIGQTVSNEVISGSLAYTLGKPYHYMVYNFFQGLGDSIVRLCINFLGGSLLAVLLVGAFPGDFWVIIPVLLTVLFAILIDFFISAVIGLMAFFTEDVSGFFFIYQKILFIFGGLLIPLDFFPSWLKTISEALPFHLILYGPAKLFVDFSWALFTSTVLQQLIWVLGLGLLLEVLYRIGGKKVVTNGG
ncbi:ABC transporter permease [Salipaludibacillus agaradhaerens]|uniref:ABC transporter permease n=1 Tax=Salipaludibacillus agaradhaerens TaxID=76935 RepID=UPI0021517075|nr:ABC transporter permease [Salipaludibacillus agaradhaerens]MCR6105804.1 ABC transporter permease [Salipaludibacillus agaradhaerens]MCR6117840.1 ABC transporter permease [Salipaludibacillus agaradhaerens]